jgi:ATP-dependent helicase/nuclease subunit A
VKSIGHVMILASAGSGKTYALTNRFVRLLALGAPPERIAALTFTRKAAGEFFDEILNKLAGAAENPAKAAQLAREIDEPGLVAADFLRMLRGLAGVMHRLRLGTLDGFFGRVARNFPLELGLDGAFEILQEHAARMERGQVLRQMFERTGELAEAQREFIEAFKRATFGAEEKRLGAQLDAFIDQHQEVFLAAPQPECWGNPARIWPEGCAWLAAVAGRDLAVASLREALGGVTMNEKQRERWEIFFAELAEWQPGAPMGKGLSYLFKNALDAWPELAVVTVERRKVELSPPGQMALRALLAAIIGGELARRMEITRGIHAILAGYESVYHDKVRRAGKLTFADVERLLRPGEDGARVLSREGAEDGRLFIDYRLDAEIEHWLLDEFQDTSFGQWSVLSNLIDEVVQDPTRTRSFFYVGDVKQAIFAWRDGDPRLFREIYDRYDAAQPGIIEERHLDESYRSGPAVITTVNRVFGDSAALESLFPVAVAQRWSHEWRDHQSAKPHLGGFVALRHAEDEAGRFAAALRILQEVAPLERGLSCALLVQKNDTAARLADYLRREGGLPAVAESDVPVCIDNPLGTALLALVQAAAHPGDTFAGAHVAMTPLAAVLEREGLTSPEAITRRVLAQIHGEGFESTLAWWVGQLEPTLAVDDDFSRLRARQITTAAAEFDTTGSRVVAEFVAFMERYKVRGSDTAAVIRVLTVHKAKGLGFDLVLLPDLEGTKLTARRDGLAIQRMTDRRLKWVLDLPPRLFVEQDPVLAAHLSVAESDACYENLSLLYVAMTRAKQGMYLITEPGAVDSSSNNFTKLLAVTVGENWQVGDKHWYKRIAGVDGLVPVRAGIGGLDLTSPVRVVHLPVRRPSGDRVGEIEAGPLFNPASRVAVEFGASVHAMLAQVEWLDTFEQPQDWSGSAGEAAKACLVEPDLAEVWMRPPASTIAEVWREQSFEVVIEGAWVTGVFDRVVVEYDAEGRTMRATVYDFKTEADGSRALQRHAAQLMLYRQACARLTGLPESQVACKLVMTGHRRLVEFIDQG